MEDRLKPPYSTLLAHRQMEKRSELQEGVADSALSDFMSEFARYLLAAGVNSSGFAEIVRIAFYRAAAEGARFGNSRVNQSAVAAMTGLTRALVRDYSKQDVPAPRARRNRIANVIRGWTTDPSFLTATYVPRRLSFGKRNSSFTSLVRKYGGDVSARSVLREMIRTSYVTIAGQFVALDPKARRTVSQARLESLAQSLIGLLREPNPQSLLPSPIQTLNGEVLFPTTSRKGRILLQKRSAKNLRALMAELQAAGHAASVESPPSAAQANRVTRTRVVLISEDLNIDALMSKARE